MPADDPSPRRIVALRTLIRAMLAQSRPSRQLAPAPATVAADPAALARAAALSAEAIARATAALGNKDADNQNLTDTLWRETLNQIERIQKLHGMPAMPFQGKSSGPGLGTEH